MSIKITPPGSKSLTNRALILSALADKKIIIKNAALCDDTKYMILGLKKIGIKCLQKGTAIEIKGNGGNFKKLNHKIEIYTGNAGTTTRFLTALSCLTGNEITIDGDKRMRERPIEELTKALNSLGAKITTNKGFPPIKILPKKITGGKILLPGNISSQYLSALLMTAPFAEKKTIINIEQNLCSRPYIKMTLKALQSFGIKVMNKNFKQFIVKPNQKVILSKDSAKASDERRQENFDRSVLTNTRGSKFTDNEADDALAESFYTIESDASSASYIAAYSAIHPQKIIIINNINTHSLQGDIKMLKYLEKMGCKTTKTKNGIKITGPKELKSIKKADMNDTPDLVMTFAVLAMFTKGKTLITNIENLRIKETDRIEALKNEIKKFGIKVKTTHSSIEIEGNPSLMNSLRNKTINIETYSDHRIAMAFGIIQDLFPRLKIQNPNCVSKSYSTFWKDLKLMQKN